MRGNSDTVPELVKQSNGKTQIRYNITEVTKEDLTGNMRASFDWEYVEIEGEPTRSKIIDSIIANVHSKYAELSLINNELATPGTSAYKDYQDLRVYAKEVADTIQQET